MAASDLWDLAEAVRDVAEAALDTLIDEGLHGAPSRRFVAPGLPQFECCKGEVPGQLSVHVQGLLERQTTPTDLIGNAARVTVGRVPASAIVLTVLRCIKPTGPQGRGAPTPADLEEGARQVLFDGWAVWNGLWRAQRDGGALAERCDGVQFRDASTIVPQGGCGGWIVFVSPNMQGYDPFAE